MLVPNIVTNPDRFFDQLDQRKGFKAPTLVVLFAMASGVPGSILIATTMSNVVSEYSSRIMWLGLLVGVFVSFTTGLILWFVQTGVLFVISSRFGAAGEFRTLLKYTGWTYFPLIFAGVIDAIAVFEAIRVIGPITEGTSAQIVAERITGASTVTVASLVRIVFLFWQGSLLVFAVKYARGVALRPAIITVLIPIGASIGFQIWELL